MQSNQAYYDLAVVDPERVSLMRQRVEQRRVLATIPTWVLERLAPAPSSQPLPPTIPSEIVELILRALATELINEHKDLLSGFAQYAEASAGAAFLHYKTQFGGIGAYDTLSEFADRMD